jgi:hypothetical protein
VLASAANAKYRSVFMGMPLVIIVVQARTAFYMVTDDVVF